MDTSNKDEQFDEQYSNVIDDISSNIKEDTISNSEEHASWSKKPKITHIENDVISKEVCLKLLFLWVYVYIYLWVSVYIYIFIIIVYTIKMLKLL